MRRKLMLAGAIVAIAVLGTALSTGAATKAKKPVTIAMFVAIQKNPVEQSIINAFNATAKKDGAAKFVVFDSNTSVQTEIANCNDAIAAGKYDAFALKAVSGPPLMDCARKAIKAGIPVVAFGNALGPNPYTAKRQIPGLSASVIELAKTNGVVVADLANLACKAKKANPCKVIYMYGPLTFDWAPITRKFFYSTIKAKYPNIKVIATDTDGSSGDWSADEARTKTRSLLQTHPDVDVFTSDGDIGAFGIIDGIKDAGKTPGKDILVTGGANSKQGKALILKGHLFGSTCLMPGTEAVVSAQLAIKAARHEKIAKPDVEVCAVYSPTGLAPLTKKNIRKFKPEF